MQEVHSNLERFLEHTTPSVPCSHREPGGEEAGDGEGTRREMCMPFFKMGELWRSFEEWSAYGAEVPLVLPCGHTIVQFYVPYLSALQIFTLQPGNVHLTKLRETCKEMEWSDTCESRDSRDDTTTSSDTKTSKFSSTIMLNAWEKPNLVPSHKLSTNFFSDEIQQETHNDNLIYQYFEKSSPYGRAPLKKKISELGVLCPLLFSLNSHDLSSTSWFSVAWYPIYRIPIGPTMEALHTCFLTFHSLWTPLTLQEGESWCNNLKTSKNGRYGGACNKTDQLAWRRKECGRRLELPAFGLASYKLKGPFWASPTLDDKNKVFTLTTCANSWLKQQKVQHPDFDFFISRHWEGN